MCCALLFVGVRCMLGLRCVCVLCVVRIVCFVCVVDVVLFCVV